MASWSRHSHSSHSAAVTLSSLTEPLVNLRISDNGNGDPRVCSEAGFASAVKSQNEIATPTKINLEASSCNTVISSADAPSAMAEVRPVWHCAAAPLAAAAGATTEPPPFLCTHQQDAAIVTNPPVTDVTCKAVRPRKYFSRSSSTRRSTIQPTSDSCKVDGTTEPSCSSGTRMHGRRYTAYGDDAANGGALAPSNIRMEGHYAGECFVDNSWMGQTAVDSASAGSTRAAFGTVLLTLPELPPEAAQALDTTVDSAVAADPWVCGATPRSRAVVSNSAASIADDAAAAATTAAVAVPMDGAKPQGTENAEIDNATIDPWVPEVTPRSRAVVLNSAASVFDDTAAAVAVADCTLRR